MFYFFNLFDVSRTEKCFKVFHYCLSLPESVCFSLYPLLCLIFWKKNICQAWWQTPIIPAHKRLRLEDHLSLGVQDQPGQHSKTRLKNKKPKTWKIFAVLFMKCLFFSHVTFRAFNSTFSSKTKPLITFLFIFCLYLFISCFSYPFTFIPLVVFVLVCACSKHQVYSLMFSFNLYSC
jgi:hypothetical protein